jgi:hypothetical protein
MAERPNYLIYTGSHFCFCGTSPIHTHRAGEATRTAAIGPWAQAGLSSRISAPAW